MLKLKTRMILLSCYLTNIAAIAQLTTSSTLSPAQLVQNVLLGSGVTASNITYNGVTPAIGSFNGINSNIGFTGGVLMSCGNIANAIGPNNSTAISAINSVGGDSDLDLIMAPTTSFDVSILEFDFIATSDTLKFRYVFGSDEYMEWVSTTPGGINDGFGFFVSGPGINGPFSNNAQNIAIIPGTTLPVTMYNLNLNSYGMYYFDNGDGMGSGTAPDGLTVQYDGFTVPLTATALLQCGQQYHIKIAIADGGDDILDSGVFLEAGSFSIPNNNITLIPVSTVIGQPGQVDTLIYEGCGSVQINLVRGGCNLSNADTMVLAITGTAMNGTDYSLLSNTIIFPATIANGSFTINSLPDNLIEGNETVTITFPGGQSTTITIVDSPPLTVKLTNDTSIFCPIPNLQLSATVNGGMAIGNYTYTWTNATGTLTSAIVNPTATTTYFLTVSDTCGNVGKDSVTVTIAPYIPLQLALNNDTTICEGMSVLLDADVINGAPGYSYSWFPFISSTDKAMVSPTGTTNYSVTITDVCGNTASDNVNITVVPISANFTSTSVTNQQWAFINQSSGSATNYLWNFGDSDSLLDSSSNQADPTHEYANAGTYNITLISTNSVGCSDTAYQTIVIYPDFFFYYPNAFTPNGNTNNDFYFGYGVGIKEYRMQIFNRWGERIFETDNIINGWDGTYKGIRVDEGVYVVKFNISGFKDAPKEIISSVTLIR